MAHYVICKACNMRFDRDKEKAIAVDGRRYVHEKCYETYISKNTKEENDYNNLEQYIKKIFNEKTLSAKIKKQIRDFKKDYNYTYSGMLKTLIWWFEIKGNSIEKANGGIGIVPYVYQEACDYYYSIYLAQIANSAEVIDNYKVKTTEIEIESPRVKIKPPKLFNLEGEE